MQYIQCKSALLAQETLFLTQKGTFFAQRSPKKVRRSRQILIRDKIAYVRAKIFLPSPPCPRTASATQDKIYQNISYKFKSKAKIKQYSDV